MSGGSGPGSFPVTRTAWPGAFVLRSRPAPSLLAPASVLLGLGTLVTLTGVWSDLIALSALGTLIAGVGFGAAALATFGTFARIALFAAAFVISYVAFSVPAVIAGFAGTAFGLRITAEVYATAIIATAVVALVLRLAAAGRRTVERQVVQ